MSRPEHIAPPEVFYSGNEARKYSTSSRVRNIQTQMTERAIELLNFPDDSARFILDIGCGSGLSGQGLTEGGHHWVGFDISTAMLEIAIENEVEGDVFLHDAGQGFRFRPGSFDGAISISAIQWLCNADTADANPYRRLMAFFGSLYSALRRGSRAVLQFYPESHKQVQLITQCAIKCGFNGGTVVDFPNSSKAKKYYLVLTTGASDADTKNEEEVEAPVANRTAGVQLNGTGAVGGKARKKGKKGGDDGKFDIKSKGWINAKKDRQRRQGKEVRGDSKFTGRKRKGLS